MVMTNDVSIMDMPYVTSRIWFGSTEVRATRYSPAFIPGGFEAGVAGGGF